MSRVVARRASMPVRSATLIEISGTRTASRSRQAMVMGIDGVEAVKMQALPQGLGEGKNFRLRGWDAVAGPAVEHLGAMWGLRGDDSDRLAINKGIQSTGGWA